MPITPEQFKKILSRSSELCAEEARNSTVSYQEDNSYNLKNSQPELDFTTPYSELDESYNGIPYETNSYDNQVISQSAFNSSRMPEAIKQSMLNETIDVSAANPNRSVLDTIMKDVPVKKNVRKMPIKEQSVPNQSIDYSIIKAIVEECIERKLNEHYKSTLNESTLKTIELSGGKIRLIDNKGNLYSAQLKKQGNINEK